MKLGTSEYINLNYIKSHGSYVLKKFYTGKGQVWDKLKLKRTINGPVLTVLNRLNYCCHYYVKMLTRNYFTLGKS